VDWSMRPRCGAVQVAVLLLCFEPVVCSPLGSLDSTSQHPSASIRRNDTPRAHDGGGALKKTVRLARWLGNLSRRNGEKGRWDSRHLDGLSLLQEDSWTEAFMWEKGSTGDSMLMDSQQQHEPDVESHLVDRFIEVCDSGLLVLGRYYLVMAITDFMRVEMCHTGMQSLLQTYTIPDYSPDIENDLFETSYRDKGHHRIKEQRNLVDFPHKHMWVTAHNNIEKDKINEESHVAGDVDGETDGAEAEDRASMSESGIKVIPGINPLLIQLDAGLTKSKKPKLAPVLPDRLSGFREDPRQWTNPKTALTHFCRSGFYLLCSLVLFFILALYIVGLLAQFGLALCATIAHYVGDHAVRDVCLG